MLSNLHLAICGHAKHGKSTLAGRLAYEFNAISPSQLEAMESEAREKGKDFNKFNLVFLRHRTDTFTRGEQNELDDPSRTNFPARASINLDRVRLTLIDTPGYPRFVNNIVYGIFLADRVIVAVDMKKGVNIGTESICRITKAFEVPILAFCVTKVDEYSKEARQAAFESICEQITGRLIGPFGLREDTPILPISALADSGITGSFETSLTPWYGGPDLTSLLRSTAEVEGEASGSQIRFTIEGGREILSPPGVGTVLVGTLESGTLRAGDRLLAEPVSTIGNREVCANVRSLHLAKGVTEGKSEQVEEAKARTILSLNVPNWKDLKEVRSAFRNGGVLGQVTQRPRVAREIEASIVFFEPDIVYSGKEYRLHPHVAQTTARIQTILSKDHFQVDLRDDEYIPNTGEIVEARVALHTPCCIEERADFPRLANFVLRENNRIIGCGKCLRILA